MKLKSAIVIALLLAMTSPLSADNDAGRESPFAMGIGARTLGMGGAFTGLADDASLLFYNPAGLPNLGMQEVTFMHATLFEGTKYNYAAWAVPITASSGTGIAIMRVGTDDIIGRQDFVATDTTSYSNTQIMFSYGRRLNSRISLGGSFKITNQSLGQRSDYAYGADLALMTKITSSLSLGLLARDIMRPGLKLDSTKENGARSYIAGLALRRLPLSENLELTLAVDLDKTDYRELKVQAGVEALFDRAYALRVGYDKNNLAIGAGVEINNLRIDYGYKVMEFIDNSHRFSLTWLLGKPAHTRADTILSTVFVPTERVLTEAELASEAAKQQGHIFFQNSVLDSALFYYQLSQQADSTDQETIRMIEAIEAALLAEESRQAVDAVVELEQIVDRYYHQAYNFYSKKYFPAAYDLIKIILEIDPDYTKAKELLEDVHEARQLEIELYQAKADSSKTIGNVIDEIEAYNHILSLDPDLAEVVAARLKAVAGLDLSQQLNLGIRLFSQGRYALAKRRFEGVLRVYGNDEVASDYLTKIEEALAAPSSLEELQQNRVIWELYLKGIRHNRNQEYKEAIAAWEQILEVFPNNINTLNNLEQARLRLLSVEGE